MTIFTQLFFTLYVNTLSILYYFFNNVYTLHKHTKQRVSLKFITRDIIKRNCWHLHAAVTKMTPIATTRTTKSTTGIPFHVVNNIGEVKQDVGLGDFGMEQLANGQVLNYQFKGCAFQITNWLQDQFSFSAFQPMSQASRTNPVQITPFFNNF